MKRDFVYITFFVSSLPASGAGGVQINTLRLATELAKRGYSVDIVVAGDRGLELMSAPKGVRIINLGAKRTSYCIFLLQRYIQSTQPKIIISAVSLSNIVAVLAKVLARVKTKLILTERVHLTTYVQEHTGFGFKALPFLMRWTYPMADALVAVSSSVAEDLAQRIGCPRDRVQVIHNPILEPNFFDRSTEPCLHHWMQTRQSPVVLGAGRLVPAKAFHILLQAFAKVREHFDARLVILGEGELRPDLERLAAELNIADYVALPGHITNPYPYMRQASMLVLSSTYEGFGNVLVEAMACGTPIVSTNCPGGPAEILAHGKWGRLVPVGDVDAMAVAILKTLKSQTHPDVVDRARDFTVERAANAYVEIIQSISHSHTTDEI